MNDQRAGGTPPNLPAVAWFVLWLCLAAGMQGVISALVPPAWGQPDLVLTLTLVAALLSDATTGAIVGLAAGMITASMVSQTVGTFLVSRTLAGFAAGGGPARLYRGNALVVLVGVFLASLLAEGVYVLAAPRFGLALGLRPMLFGALGNALLSLPTLWLLRRCGWGEPSS